MYSFRFPAVDASCQPLRMEKHKTYLLQAHITPKHFEFLIAYHDLVEPILEVLLYIPSVFFILVIRDLNGSFENQ